METLLQDLRYGARMLLKRPGFTLIAVITLCSALALTQQSSASSATCCSGRLPFAEPDRLVAIAETHTEISRAEVATPDFEDWQRQAQSFTEIAAWSRQTAAGW